MKAIFWECKSGAIVQLKLCGFPLAGDRMESGHGVTLAVGAILYSNTR